MKRTTAVVILAAAASAAPATSARAQCNTLDNPSFEVIGSPPSPSGPRGWRSFNAARHRSLDDGLGPAFVRTGTYSIELPSDPTQAFVGYTTDVFNPDTLMYDFNPRFRWGRGDVVVSGFYLIPSDRPFAGITAGGAGAGLKLEFRRENTSIHFAVEDLSISGHTSDQWVPFTMRVTVAQQEAAGGAFPPFAERVSVLPFIFPANMDTGTVFWDDLSYVQCLADWNTDSQTNSSDISAFLTAWLTSVQQSDLEADFNDDGTTNSSDISAFLSCWLHTITNGC